MGESIGTSWVHFNGLELNNCSMQT